MNSGNDADLAYVAEAIRPVVPPQADVRKGSVVAVETSVSSGHEDEQFEGDEPTEEELLTLRRVSGKIPWQAFTVAVVEFCERFSYYGTTVVFTNYIQKPKPSPTGALALAMNPSDFKTSGGFGLGQKTAFGLTTFNTFWSYVMPLVGGYVADTFLGRFATIQWSILFAIIGHIILIVSSIPSVLDHPSGGIAAFAIGLVIMGIGTGGFKSNIAPLIGEQVRDRRKRVITLPTGERVIRDPTVTYSRIYLYFYLLINAGSLTGQISMVFAEKYVGFWLSFTLPTALFLIAPMVLFACKNKYIKMPPTGSVLYTAMRLWLFSMKGRFSLNPMTTWRNFNDPNYWEVCKPSHLGENRPAWMFAVDDEWVDQVKRALHACKVFCFYPLYWLAYNQMVSNLTSQSATMQLHGAPNDVINNLNPISLIVFIPIFDLLVYPALRRARIPFTPLKRIALGFLLASAAMISACVIQYYIYKLGPCGMYANGTECDPAPINVWVQTIPYVLIGFSEIMASISGLEYAFTKAPENMRSLVQGLYLLMNAFSSAIGQALVPLADDPNLVINYGLVAGLAALGGVLFWACFHNTDKKEDSMNMLADTAFKGKIRPLDDPENTSRRASIARMSREAEREKL